MSDSTYSLSPITRNGGGTERSTPSIPGFGFPGTQPPSLAAFQKSPDERNPDVVKRGSLWITRHLFRLYSSEGFSGTENKRPNVTTNEHCSYCSGKPKGLGSWESELGMKTKCIWETDFGHLSDQIYMFLINYDITAAAKQSEKLG